jgi:DNA-binding transcriptional LysR family regulator
MRRYVGQLTTRDNANSMQGTFAPSGEIMDLIGGLRAFVRVAESGSFSAVAREINASQSAVTRQIAQLEDQFNVRLFNRTTRRLSLTGDGEALIEHARHLLDEADALEEKLGRQQASPAGLVRVGLPVAAALFVAQRLPILLQRHPGLSIDLVVDDQRHDMVDSRLDVALRGGENADSSLIARGLGSFRWVTVASPEYIRRAGEPSTPEDLEQHECILQGPVASRRTWRFQLDGGESVVRVNGSMGVDESEVARRIALAGHGIVRLSAIQVVDDIRAGTLIRLLPAYRSAPVPLHLVYPSRRYLAPRIRVVMDFLSGQIESVRTMLEAGYGA